MVSARATVRSLVHRLPSPRDEAALEVLRSARRLVRAAPAPQPGSAVTTPAVAAPPLPAPVDAMTERLERAFASGRPGPRRRAVREVRRLEKTVRRLATPERLRSGGTPMSHRGARSTQYMIELLPHLQRLMRDHPRGHEFSVLDVGPGTGHGTGLLADLYGQGALGYSMQVSALDIRDTYRVFIESSFPRVRFVCADVFDHDEVYDVVVTSHAIEHIPDPLPFARRLQEIARLAVFVSAPFEEPPEALIPGHVNSIDRGLLDQLDPEYVDVHRSACWGAVREPPYDSVIARLPGRAGAPASSEPPGRRDR